MKDERSASGSGGPDVTSDLDVERKWLAESADLLAALSGNYRVLADVLPRLGEADRNVLRNKVARIAERTVDALRINVAMLRRQPVTKGPP